MERLCGLAIGVPLNGRAYPQVPCGIYRDGRLCLSEQLQPCRVQPKRRKKSDGTERWVRGPHGFIRTTPAPERDPYVWYGWEAAGHRGGGCNGVDYPDGLHGMFHCRLMLRRTRALLADLPLRWCIKTGVPVQWGVIPGQRLVPPAQWSQLSAAIMHARLRYSEDGRFMIVHAAIHGSCA